MPPREKAAEQLAVRRNTVTQLEDYVEELYLHICALYRSHTAMAEQQALIGSAQLPAIALVVLVGTLLAALQLRSRSEGVAMLHASC